MAADQREQLFHWTFKTIETTEDELKNSTIVNLSPKIIDEFSKGINLSIEVVDTYLDLLSHVQEAHACKEHFLDGSIDDMRI